MPIQLLLRIAPYLICLLVGLGSAYKLTADHYRAVIAAKDLEAAKELQVAQENVIVAQKNQQDITEKVTTAYETKRKEIESKYSNLMFSPSIGMRLNTSSETGSLRPVPQAPSRPDGSANCNRLSAELRKAAEQNTLQLIYLQDWVAQQESADK